MNPFQICAGRVAGKTNSSLGTAALQGIEWGAEDGESGGLRVASLYMHAVPGQSSGKPKVLNRDKGSEQRMESRRGSQESDGGIPHHPSS